MVSELVTLGSLKPLTERHIEAGGASKYARSIYSPHGGQNTQGRTHYSISANERTLGQDYENILKSQNQPGNSNLSVLAIVSNKVFLKTSPTFNFPECLFLSDSVSVSHTCRSAQLMGVFVGDSVSPSS